MYPNHLGQFQGRTTVQPAQNSFFVSQETEFVDGIKPPETAAKMVQLAQAALVDPEINGMARFLSKDLIDEQDSPFAAVMSEMQTIYNWVTGKVRYTRDPNNVELVYSPVQLLRLIKKYGRWGEDCDSQQLLALVLMMSLGRRCRITIAGFRKDNPEFFSHVFAEVLVPGIPGYFAPRWIVLDPALRQKVHKMVRHITTVRYFYP